MYLKKMQIVINTISFDIKQLVLERVHNRYISV